MTESMAASDVADGISRVVILGASNISLGWPFLLQSLRTLFSAPLQIYTAHGMGRSYCGERSRFLFRQLPGILKSNLWEELPQRVPADPSPCVLITDLGNDLVYGRSPLDVATAAEECIDRLRSWDARCRIVVSRPPVESVHKVGWFRFLLCRLLLFPACPLSLAQAKAATAELDELLLAMACEQEVEIHKPAPADYGLDPIHVRRRCRLSAFRSMLQTWNRKSVPDAQAIPTSAMPGPPGPSVRWVMGTEKHTPQPSRANQDVQVFAY